MDSKGRVAMGPTWKEMKQRKTKRKARRPERRRREKGVLGYAAAAADEEAAAVEDAMDGEWSDGDVNFLFNFFLLIWVMSRVKNPNRNRPVQI